MKNSFASSVLTASSPAAAASMAAAGRRRTPRRCADADEPAFCNITLTKSYELL